MWDISTGHITEMDSKKLTEKIKDFPGQIIHHQYGWMIPVIRNERETLKDLKLVGMSAAFIKLYKYAQKKNYDWINFDQDADQLNHFKIFEW